MSSPFIGGQAVSDGAEEGGQWHRSWRVLKTDSGVYDGTAMHTDSQPKGYSSIMLSTCWTIEEKCEWSRREAKHSSQQVHYHCNYPNVLASSTNTTREKKSSPSLRITWKSFCWTELMVLGWDRSKTAIQYRPKIHSHTVWSNETVLRCLFVNSGQLKLKADSLGSNDKLFLEVSVCSYWAYCDDSFTTTNHRQDHSTVTRHT